MNVIGSRPDGWWKDRQGAMKSLVERLDAHAAGSGDALTVFLDAKPFEVSEQPLRHVEVVFAFPGRDAADDTIVKALAEQTRPAGDDVAVVTSDHGLADRVEALGVNVISASAFRRRLESEPNH